MLLSPRSLLRLSPLQLCPRLACFPPLLPAPVLYLGEAPDPRIMSMRQLLKE